MSLSIKKSLMSIAGNIARGIVGSFAESFDLLESMLYLLELLGRLRTRLSTL